MLVTFTLAFRTSNQKLSGGYLNHHRFVLEPKILLETLVVLTKGSHEFRHTLLLSRNN
jgi:hypothetical protein